ncbi:hypothetical protein DFS34DRAFT_653590 [Phlyctochytrium arcticum]|nr:hypothetical protein DFS34DRAFT_653590 [Phlyctochytrium arcticum]
MPSQQSIVQAIVLLGAIGSATADMRIASKKGNGFADTQLQKNPALAAGRDGSLKGLARRQNANIFAYQVPSTFGIAKLVAQEKNNNDNFLRSNIDNEANKRNTAKEAALDMTPCRTDGIATAPLMSVTAGQTVEIPLQFNNPHDGECEVNIWSDMKAATPQVAPISRFPCGGGYAQNRPNFTVPADFPNVCGPGAGCLMQLYWHSVEPRTYSVCSNFEIAAPKGARLRSRQQSSVKFNAALFYSDSFDTAHIDSTHSGYRGQQPDAVGAQLKARIELQSYTGNGGLLKDAEPANVIAQRNNLRGQVENAVKKAEAAAIKENKAAQSALDAGAAKGANGVFEGQKYAVVLNDNAKRQFTNTYVTNVDYTAIRDAFLPKFAKAGLTQQGVATKDGLATPEVFGMKNNSLKTNKNAALAPGLAKALGATARRYLARRDAGHEDDDVATLADAEDDGAGKPNPDDAE